MRRADWHFMMLKAIWA
ncbi:unnamed protein product [Spirodela intermedia]|uniref:Uncharacterized protein n=2 Tax=Spirodela intermedia TaxID=51605 RepID=A0A7I8JLW4_SPIIN|nr:unnamed protein product [Spirodela intermedia]CAA6671156.1 unnamed protein product [Spirodela intermedia]CAA7408266.1 unnamed protein product [Spirodela intermedia]